MSSTCLLPTWRQKERGAPFPSTRIEGKTKTKKIIFNHVRDDKIKLIEANKEKIEFEYQLASDGDVVEI